jgi:HK97 gp10 family phage protein
MNVDGTVNVKGLAELQLALDTLAGKVQNNIMRGALRAGQKVIMIPAKILAPVGPTSAENARLYGTHPGSLRDSLRVGAKIIGDQVIGTTKAGNKEAFYAHMVEGGTKAHWIKPVNGKSLFIGGHLVNTVFHPGARANSFMKKALDSQAQAAVERVGQYVRARLTKQGIEIPDSPTEGLQ